MGQNLILVSFRVWQCPKEKVLFLRLSSLTSVSQPLGSSLTISSEADWEWVEIKLISGAIKKFSVCIFYSVFAHFIHININRSTREHIKNNICAILNSYNKDGSGKFWATFSRRNVPKSHCIIGVKGMHVSAFDGFSQKSFF